MSCAIRACGLGRKFGRRAALEPLDLEVPEGAIYCLAGSSGAGKTTCIRVLLNILRPSSGRAEVLGIDSRHLAPRDFAQIGYLAGSQEMPGGMSAGYYLRFLSGFYPTWDAGIESALVRQFQLPLDRKLADLSAATRMKTALVAALAYRPKVIVLDEPFAGLDALSRGELLQTLLGRAEGSIFFAAGDPAEAEPFATHIGYLEEGRLRFSEDLNGLRARFRQVVVTFHEDPPLPADWPATWVAVERGPGTLRFVETRFDPQATPAESHRRFPEALSVAVNPMPPGGIVSALVKTWRPVP